MGTSSLSTKYGFQSFSHYSNGRSGANVDKIVIHHMATTNYDIVPEIWKTREASAHYGIGKNGEIRAYVDEANTFGMLAIGTPISQVLVLNIVLARGHPIGASIKQRLTPAQNSVLILPSDMVWENLW